MSEKEMLIEIGYKNLVLSIISRGFFDNFLNEDSHFLNFKNKPDFFVECIEKLKDKYTSVDRILVNFFRVNPEEKYNIDLMKKILKVVTYSEEVSVIFRNCGDENFIKDYDLMRRLSINTKGRIFIDKISNKILKDEKLRDCISDIDGFSLLWFDLPEPKNNEMLTNVLIKDFHSYRKLSEENKKNKEYLLCALQNLKENRAKNTYLNIESQIYGSIPCELKKDNDVALLLAEVGFVTQVEEVFKNEKILEKIIDTAFKDGKPSKSLQFLESLPKSSFTNYKNIEVFLGGISKYSKYIGENIENYGVLHKTIKAMAKENSYVKELFKKEDSNWNNGNITDVKYEGKSFFRNVFSVKCPKMLEEFQYYSKMQELKDSLEKKTSTKKTLKV